MDMFYYSDYISPNHPAGGEHFQFCMLLFPKFVIKVFETTASPGSIREILKTPRKTRKNPKNSEKPQKKPQKGQCPAPNPKTVEKPQI